MGTPNKPPNWTAWILLIGIPTAIAIVWLILDMVNKGVSK